MTLRVVIMICVFVTWNGRSPHSVEASATAPDLLLRVELDRQEFLPAEPVVVGLSIENHGSAVFEDLGKLSPPLGFIALSLTRDGKGLPWAARYETWLFAEEGARLQPGARLCDVFDLVGYFGPRGSISLDERTFTFRHLLTPGTYTLRTRFRARIGIRKDLPQITVEGNEVTFVVGDESAIPSPEMRALELVQDSSGYYRMNPPLNRWETFRSQHLDRSRYLASLSRVYLPLADSVDVIELAKEYASHGGGRLGAAMVLRSKFERFSYRLNALEAWLNRVELQDSTGTFTCFLRMWKEIVAQGRKYGRSED